MNSKNFYLFNIIFIFKIPNDNLIFKEQFKKNTDKKPISLKRLKLINKSLEICDS